MYLFYQTDSEGRWQVVEDRGHPATLNRVTAAGAIKMSILAADTPEPSLDKLNVKYKGPFFADIDCAGNIPLAAESTKNLISKLKSLDVPIQDIQIFASGSKGFHVIVDAKKFSDGKPRKLLPLAYKAMAAQLYVIGLDLGVYSLGMGTSWRIENIKREDTGTYRVRISADELEGLTNENYVNLVKAPREVPKRDANPSLAIGLRSLFISSCDIVTQQKANKTEEVPQDLEKIRDDVPSCAQMLSEGRSAPEKTFNEVAMQMSAYIARAKPSEMDIDRLRARFIESHATENHPINVRTEAFDGLLGYVKSSDGFKFSCAGMRSVLKHNNCKECPIYHSTVKVDTAKKLGLEVRDDGYYAIGDPDRRLSSFLIKPTAVLKEYNHDGDKSIRTACLVDLQEGPHIVRDFVWDEGAWKNKSALISMIAGIRNFGFFGSDTDVQKIKNLVLEGEDSMSEIVRVYSSGMHMRKVGDKYSFTYVEPDYSVNSQGVKDLYKLTGSVPSPVHIGSLPVLKLSDTEELKNLETGLRNLVQINAPQEIAKILGWVSACHLKVHIRNSPGMDSAFPLLGVHGSAQSGKNKTAELFCWLNGSTYGTQQSVFNVPGSKAFPMTNLLITSTTIPRIFDELNPERVQKTLFNSVVEAIKCSWDCSSIPRGTIGAVGLGGSGQTSAKLIEQYATAPVIYCSEQEVTGNTALMQRTMPVHLSAKSREGREGFLGEASKYRESFNVFSRYLVQSALNTPLEAIPELLSANEKHIPAQITDRARHSFLVVLMGLDFFEHNFKELGLNLDEEFTAVKQSLIDYLSENKAEILRDKTWSNIDTVLNTLAIMASFSDDPKRSTIQPNKEYLYSEESNRLFLSSHAAHWLYKAACSSQGETPLISTHRNFIQLVREQPYFETDQYFDPSGQILMGSACLVLKIDELKKKGIETDLFKSRDMVIIN